jgi:hypothetical protein
MSTQVQELPLYDDPYFEYTLNIEDENKIFTLRWADRTASWYIDIKKEDLTPIIEGVRLVSYFPLLADYALSDKNITGYIYLVDSGDYISNKLSNNPEALKQYYRMFYIYEEE